MERVAIIGGGGGTGYAAVDVLLEQGKSVRAVVRDPTKYKDTWAASASQPEVVAGDVTDPRTLRSALAGTQGVIYAASTSTFLGAKAVDCEGIKNVADVARELGTVHHIVLVSSRLVTPSNRWHPIRLLLNAARWGIMDQKWEGEKLLRESGVPYTIVRPGGLTNDPPGAMLLSAAQGDSGPGGRCSRADTAAVCVAALTDPAAKNVTLELLTKPAAEAPGGAVPSLAEQLKGFFKGLAPDTPPA